MLRGYLAHCFTKRTKVWMNVAEYQKKLYTQEAIDASDAAWHKETIKNK